jgi:hypothetical protein
MTKCYKDSSKPTIFEKHSKLTAIMLVVIGLLIVLLLDRALAGIFLKHTIRIKDPYFHHTLSPNSFEYDTWGYSTYPVFTNSLGFKDKGNRNIELTTNKYRIVFIGDSTVEGLGYPYEKTFVGLVDNALDRSKYDILNAGVMSYSPKLYYLKMKKLIEDTELKMNELVCFIDISDIQDEIVYEDFQPVNGLLYKYELENYVRKKSLIGNKAIELSDKMNKWLGKKKSTAAKGDTKFDRDDFKENYYKERFLWTDNDMVMNKWGTRGLALCEQYMDKLYLLTRKNKIKMTIAVFPWPYQIKQKDIDSKQVKFWKKFSKDRDIEFIDYFPYFIQSSPSEEIIKKYFIPGDSHWNEEGNKLVAKVYLDFFSREE